METKCAIELKGITKRFGKVVANKNVSLSLKNGEILSILGENGSGKTTLMNMLSGIYFPDEGEIIVNGQEACIRSPFDAFQLGIGMIHQHFKLVDVFTAEQNIIMGLPGKNRLDMKAISKEIQTLIEKYGFEMDTRKKIYEMSVSEKQTVEIMKVLYRGAKILILDEPTAVLTPQETEKLFSVLRRMKEDGKAIIIITHKLHEVLDISDRVAVLRKGEYIGCVDTKDADELSLTEMMVGKKVELDIEHPKPQNVKTRIKVEHLTCTDQYGVKMLDDVSFDIKSGEILGIAGIAGSGQKELLEAIAGLHAAKDGSRITYYTDEKEEVNLIEMNPLEMKKHQVSIAFVPEDRLGMGLVGNMDMIDNMMLRSYRNGKSFFTDRKKPALLAEKVKDELEVVTPGIKTAVRKMSGGNVQKVLVGREIADNPQVLMTAYAVRGLDINTSYAIYHLLTKQKEQGAAVVYVGEDLDVLLSLCDRILVLCGGCISDILPGEEATKEQVGYLMTHKGGAGK